MKLTPEVKAKWLTALRSGKFKQAQHTLRELVDEYSQEAHYCCLGVLCELYRQEFGGQWKQRAADCASFIDPIGHYSEGSILTSSVAEWAGFIEEWIPHTAIMLKLAELNDGDTNRDTPPHTFCQIANWIEENL